MSRAAHHAMPRTLALAFGCWLALAAIDRSRAATTWPGTPEPAPIAQARADFESSRFAAVVGLLQPVLATDSLPAPTRAVGFELLARSHVRLGEIENGVTAFMRTLDLEPGLALDPRRVRDDELAVLSRARRQWLEAHPEWSPPPDRGPKPVAFYRQRRYQIAGGMAIAGLAIIIRQQRRADGSGKVLPPLPGHP